MGEIPVNTEILFHPIGIIRTPFTEREGTPIQASLSETRGSVDIFPEFEQGLQDLEGFSHIFLLYAFHESSGFSLLVKPFLDDQLHGLFATRHPNRPNPLGLSVVRLLGREGNTLEIDGVDMLDGTLLLDIKPYLPEFDVRTGTRNGWYETRKRA